MNTSDFLNTIINPTLAAMGPRMVSDEARVMLLAIAQQESALADRRQVGRDGHWLDKLARGWWQFEAGGGVAGVMNHPATAGVAHAFCDQLTIPWDQGSIHEALAWNDRLACVFARLLLFSDPSPLPPLGDASAAWEVYQRNWRPGKPHPSAWPANYGRALAAVTTGSALPAPGAMGATFDRAMAQVQEQISQLSTPPAKVPPAPVQAPVVEVVAATPSTPAVVGQERPPAPVLPTMVTKNGFKTSAFFATVGGILLMLAPTLLPMFDSPEAQQLTQKSALAAFAFAGLRMALQALTAYSLAKAARPPANPPA